VDPERLDDRPNGHADLPPAPVDTLAEDFDDSADQCTGRLGLYAVDITCRHRQPMTNSASPRTHDERAAA
jgi:hypothetical protein